MAKDNTVTIGERNWQLEKSRFRNSLAGCTVTIHEHLDGAVSVRYGPHVVGRYDGQGQPIQKRKGRGKDGAVETMENPKRVSHRSHRPLEIPPRDFHFPTAPATIVRSPKNRKPRSGSRRGSSGQIE